MHLDPYVRAYTLGFSGHKAHQTGATGSMLGKNSDAQQHEAAPHIRAPGMVAGRSLEPWEYWRVKTGLSNKGMGGDGSNH